MRRAPITVDGLHALVAASVLAAVYFAGGYAAGRAAGLEDGAAAVDAALLDGRGRVSRPVVVGVCRDGTPITLELAPPGARALSSRPARDTPRAVAVPPDPVRRSP